MADPGSSSAPGFDFGDEEQVGGNRPVLQARRVAVLLPLPLPEAYDYKVPAQLELGEGDYVEVPLGPRHLLGVVWGPGSGEVSETKLRPVAQRFDIPPMPEIHRRFIDWVAAYTMAPPGAVLRGVKTSFSEDVRPGKSSGRSGTACLCSTMLRFESESDRSERLSR